MKNSIKLFLVLFIFLGIDNTMNAQSNDKVKQHHKSKEHKNDTVKFEKRYKEKHNPADSNKVKNPNYKNKGKSEGHRQDSTHKHKGVENKKGKSDKAKSKPNNKSSEKAKLKKEED